jgi:RNA polymerase sigma-70 factor (ECF subfamily)
MPGDEELWNKLSRRDAQAFEGFYRENSPRLHRFVKVWVGSSQAADDVAQETFLQLWKLPNGFDPSRSTLKAYVFGIARKRAADWWRHHRPAGEPSPAPAESVVDEGCTLLLTDAISRLDPQARSVLWLREVEGYSYEELSEIFEIPLGTVKSRLFAAREQLRRMWKSGK